MKWIFFCSALILVACNNKNDQKATQIGKLAELRIHLEERLKAVDRANKLDSFKLIRIDTLTQRDKFSLLNKALADSLNKIKLRMEVYSELYQGES